MKLVKVSLFPLVLYVAEAVVLLTSSPCESCGASCLDEQDVTPMAHCVELDRACAEVCSLAAKLLIRKNEFSHEFLAFCEKICRHCAKESNGVSTGTSIASDARKNV